MTLTEVEVIDICNIADNRTKLASLLDLDFEEAQSMSAFDMLCMLCERSAQDGFIIEHNLSDETIIEIEKEISLKAKKSIVLANSGPGELEVDIAQKRNDDIISQINSLINI